LICFQSPVCYTDESQTAVEAKNRKEGVQMTILMTLKTIFIDPLVVMITNVAHVLPTLVGSVVIFMVGILITKVVGDLVHRLFKEIHLDKIGDRFGITAFLKKGGIKTGLSDLIVSFIYLIFIVTVLIMTLESLGYTTVRELLSRLMGYVPQVVTASFVMVLGLVIAKFVSRIIYVVATSIGMPNPKTIERISRWAMMIYAVAIVFEELGLSYILEGTTFHILFGGLVLAYALAYGLGGRDIAAKHLASK
jgi:hypothetical protein